VKNQKRGGSARTGDRIDRIPFAMKIEAGDVEVRGLSLT
jgi:hypothetical protein